MKKTLFFFMDVIVAVVRYFLFGTFNPGAII